MLKLARNTGRWWIAVAESSGHAIALMLRTLYACRRAFGKRRDVLRQMLVCGVMSLPVALLVGVFAGMVLALQTGIELRQYGAAEKIGSIVAASMCREMGPLMTAIILCARVGSAMAAEIGTMKVSEEIDALEVMSIDPVTYLVMPRFLALTIMAPVVTIYSDLVGILGGAVVGKYQIGITYTVYFQNALEIICLTDVFSGLIKSLVFGLIIAVVSCAQGMRATSGAEGVGRATRNSVVTSQILIIIFNYVLTSVARHFYR